MSNFHITGALKSKAGSPSAKLVLLALANWADSNGFAYPGQESLSNITELGERTIRRCMDDLAALGLITRARRWTKAGARTSNAYQLHLIDSDPPVGVIKAPPEFAERMGLPADLAGRKDGPQPANLAGRQPANLAGRKTSEPTTGTPSSTAMPSTETAEKHVDTSVLTHQKEREGSAPETERTVSPPDFSLPLDAQVEVALRYPESPEAQALLAANGISTDQRPLWDLKRFLKQTLGDQADHPQVVGNLTAWAAAEHSLQEIRAAWLRAVERRKREGRGLRAVHHFVDILNGTYQPDSHELAAENAAAVAQAEQAAAAAPKPGDRVKLADGSVHTVHDFDESGGWVIFADGAGHCRVTDCVVVQ